MRRGYLCPPSRSRHQAISESASRSPPSGCAHDRADLLALHLVGEPDHRHLGDARMAGHHLLDLPRVHVETAADDQILLAVDDREEPVGVLAAQVSDRNQPSTKTAAVASGLPR
jgi:hypothetical protein